MENLIKLLDEVLKRIDGKKIEQVDIETEEFRLSVKQYVGPREVVAPSPSVEVKEVIQTSKDEINTQVQENKKYHVIKSPLVGTFYRAPSPGAPPFVEEGDIVSKGQVLCIIEALKVMNEIESDIDGKVVKILVENGQPVEYGQELFYIEPV